MLKRYTIKTERRGLYNITSYVRQAVTESGVQSGIAVVFCPHTTATITNFFLALGRVSISLSLTDREQETFL